MGAFENELKNQTFQGNVVLAISDSDGSNTEYYPQYEPESGWPHGTDNMGLITGISISGTTVDLRDVKTSVASLTFSLLDKDDDISEKVSVDPYAWQGRIVQFYYGFLGGLSFNSYRLMSTTTIRSLSKKESIYTFKCQEAASDLKTRIYTEQTELTVNLTDVATSMTVGDTTNFDSTGLLKIDSEVISYSGKTATTFTGLTRGHLNSDAEEHETGILVNKITTIQAASMDIILDTILTEIGIDPDLVNSDSFTDLRDDTFIAEADYLFYAYDIVNGLEWLEENILAATNTRLVTDINGKIKIIILDQVSFLNDADDFSEDYTIGSPSYVIDSSKIVNTVVTQSDWDEGTEKYLSVQTFTDADSIAQFGPKELTLDLKGVYSSLDTLNLIPENRATRLLLRLALPKAEIAMTTFLSKLDTQVGEQALVTNRYLPQPVTGGSFESLLEIVSRAPVNFDKNAQIKWKLQFTSYNDYRIGLITPSPLITAVTDQSNFEIPLADAEFMKVGFKLRLWNYATGAYYADAAIAIEAINKTEITMASTFSTTLTTSIGVTFPDFDDATEEQKKLNCWITDGTNEFADGSKAYQIVLS